MTNYFYSATKNAFYPQAFQDSYIAAETWPTDAIEIDDSIYEEFAASIAPEGKMRSAGENGLPCWIDIPGPTQEQIVASNIAVLDKLLQACAIAAFPLQSRVDSGIATDEQTTALAELKQYSISLTDPDIIDLTQPLLRIPPAPAALGSLR